MKTAMNDLSEASDPVVTTADRAVSSADKTDKRVPGIDNTGTKSRTFVPTGQRHQDLAGNTGIRDTRFCKYYST